MLDALAALLAAHPALAPLGRAGARLFRLRQGAVLRGTAQGEDRRAADALAAAPRRAFARYAALASALPDPRFLVLLGAPPGPDTAWGEALRATLDWAQRVPVLPVLAEDLAAADGVALRRIAAFLGIGAGPLLAGRARLGAALPPPGGAAPAAPEDRAALDALRLLARHPPDYAGAWRTLGRGMAVIAPYAEADRRVVEYGLWRPPGARAMLRAPAVPPARADEAVLFLGSAATFGRAVRHPFAQRLAGRLGVTVVNAGIGGARPATFLADPGLRPYLDRARAVVLEAVSARGYATELFVPNSHHANAGLPPGEAGPPRFVDHVYRAAFRRGEAAALRRARMVCLAAWLRDMKRLAARAAGRCVLLYLSQRPPGFVSRLDSFEAWAGGFPHHVDRAAIEALRPHVRAVVEVVSTAGLPEVARDARTGEPVPIFAGRPDPTRNTYYPSQAMHDEAAARLEPALRALLRGEAEVPSFSGEGQGAAAEARPAR
ncbi:DUF6473 family protein [Crenalkalicoccus roseus]|uniref:DUF6473 family protein n=1 Tax=Crenalkalicoccus roseus TaxID=1485588 RepID=UPI00108152C0|nr:DUF6473 family protein [Crenalkalicoccus roseus]